MKSVDRFTHHNQCPNSVVQEDERSGREHGEADELVKL